MLAAGLALLGVLATLLVTVRRGDKEARVAREDAYRDAARTVVVELLVAANEFQRYGLVLSDPAQWAALGYDRSSAIAESTEQAMKALHQRLATASLLLTDEELQLDLESLEAATQRAAALVHNTVDSFWAGKRPSSLRDADETWRSYAAASDQLRGDALRLLRPMIRSDGTLAERRARQVTSRPFRRY